MKFTASVTPKGVHFPMFFKSGVASEKGDVITSTGFGESRSTCPNEFVSCPRHPLIADTIEVGEASLSNSNDEYNFPVHEQVSRVKRLFQGSGSIGTEVQNQSQQNGAVSNSSKDVVVVANTSLTTHQERWNHQSSLAGEHKQDPQLLGEF